jgi:hypothetical protein
VKTRLWVAGAALVAALAAVPATALGSTAHTASNNQTFLDSTGEDPNAPDITSINVSNDDSGNIAFKVNISNRPALTPDMVVLLYLDTDQNKATGDPQNDGADYVIQLVAGSVDLFQWNGSDYAPAQSQASLTYAYDTTGATIRISQSDLNRTHGFNFFVLAVSGVTTDASGNADFTNAHGDSAPDVGHGTYSYTVISKVKLTQTAFTIAPSPAVAGKRVTVSIAANESDSGGPVTAGAVSCSAVVAGKHLTSSHSLANGVASCKWILPKASKGKTLHGTITLTVQGTKLTKSFSVKVK